jgi:methyl-accepting chemotaxis protein
MPQPQPSGFFARLSLKQRVLFGVLGLFVLTFSASIAFTTLQVARVTRAQALETARAEAKQHALAIQKQLEHSMLVARELAFSLEGIKAVGVSERAVANSIVRRTLEGNPAVIGAYTAWEPGAWDGKDKDFVGQPGHDASGRYIPYWNRGGGQIAVEPLADYDNPGPGDYYQLPKKTGVECVINPYLYPIAGQEVLIASFVVPVLKDGVFQGITGTDMSLAEIQALVEKIRPFETGYASLIAHSGVYVADVVHTNANQSIGTALNGEAVHRIFVPVRVGRSTTPWSFALAIPEAKLFAESRRLLALSATIALAGLGVTAVLLYGLLHRITRTLSHISDSLGDGARSVAAASDQISGSSQSLAEGSSEQAASLEETSASLEEMASMTRRNADSAEAAKSLANQTRLAAEAGATDMAAMAKAMDEIKVSSDGISKILKSIDEIAFQTNILALNAAVEAARAGEAGAGFAVVAEEVRNLAKRSADAARETAEGIENSIAKSTQGVAISAKVATSLADIVAKARQVDNLVAEIASASKEQNQGIGQINTAMSQMDRVTQTTAASAEECASASSELNAQAQSLKDAVDQLVALVSGGGQTQPAESPAHRPHHSSPAPRAQAGAPVQRTIKPTAKEPLTFH